MSAKLLEEVRGHEVRADGLVGPFSVSRVAVRGEHGGQRLRMRADERHLGEGKVVA